MSEQEYIRHSSIKGIAVSLKLHEETLRAMIRITPELHALIQPYIDAKQRLLPKAIVKTVYDKLGYPD